MSTQLDLDEGEEREEGTEVTTVEEAPEPDPFESIQEEVQEEESLSEEELSEHELTVEEVEEQGEGDEEGYELPAQKMESFLSFIEGESPTDITQDTGRYLWNVLLPGWIFRSHKDIGGRDMDESHLLRHVSSLCCHGKLQVTFTDDLQFNTVIRYEDEFKRGGSNSNPVTLQDVKDVALFTALIDIPKIFIKFFHIPSVDRFLRSLIVYMQYFYQIWLALKRRQEEAKRKLAHPNTGRLYKCWRRDLSLLRYQLARDYSVIYCGLAPDTAPYYTRPGPTAHTNNAQKILFELLYAFSVRVVQIALFERTNNIFKEEVERLFRPPVERKFSKVKYLWEVGEVERSVIEAQFYHKTVVCQAPVCRELQRPARGLPFDNAKDCLQYLGRTPVKFTGSKVFQLLQYVYLLPEDQFAKANIRVGILGFKRELFDAILSNQGKKTRFDVAEIVVESGSTFPVDNEERFPEPVYLVPKMDWQRPYDLSTVIIPQPTQDRTRLWLENAKLSHRCYTEFMVAMRKRM